MRQDIDHFETRGERRRLTVAEPRSPVPVTSLKKGCV